MVLGHNSLPSIEFKLIYAFHMPAFFILSGYLYKPKKWYKTLKCMFIPILFYSFIRFIFYILNQSLDGKIEWQWNIIERCFLPFLKMNVHNEITVFLEYGFSFV